MSSTSCPFSTRDVTETVAGCLSSVQEVSNSLSCDRRRARRGPHPLRTRTFRARLADEPGSAPLPLPSRLAHALGRLVHPSQRVGRLASPMGRLARRAVAVRRRAAVHAGHVGIGRWSRRALAVVDPRAGLPRVREVAG